MSCLPPEARISEISGRPWCARPACHTRPTAVPETFGNGWKMGERRSLIEATSARGWLLKWSYGPNGIGRGDNIVVRKRMCQGAPGLVRWSQVILPRCSNDKYAARAGTKKKAWYDDAPAQKNERKNLSVLLSSSLSSLFTKYRKSLCHILSHHCFPSPYRVLFLDQLRTSDLHVAIRRPVLLTAAARIKLYFLIIKSHLFFKSLTLKTRKFRCLSRVWTWARKCFTV